MMKPNIERISVLLISTYMIFGAIQSGGSAVAAARQSAQANVASGSSTSEIDLNSFLRNGASALGIPLTLLVGGRSGSSVAVGDFNGDGKSDLAVCGVGSSVTWMLAGDGAGGFSAPALFAQRLRQAVVAVGDFNNDGIEDRVSKNSLSDDATVIFGDASDGTGKTGNPQSRSLMIGDFNGDRLADLAVTDGDSNRVSIFLGNKQGRLKAATGINVGSGPVYIATGDFNADGIADLAIANRLSNDISILLGGKKGLFDSAINFRAGSGPASIAVGDFNGDAIEDLAVANDLSKDVSILLGDGSGNFAAPANFAAIGESNIEKDNGSSLSIQAVAAGPIVASLTLSPSTITGGSGASSTATVTLSEPAPATGTDVSLASSNIELAASQLIVNVPAGQTTATFNVATNSGYRRYSGLSFQAVISASANGGAKSATLTVTAQPRPADIDGDSTQREGFVCGGSFPAGAGERGVLYQCFKGANFGTPGKCRFVQECNNGCLSQPSRDGLKFQDVCSANPAFSFVINPKAVLGGETAQGNILLNTPAPPPEAGVFVVSSSSSVTVPFVPAIPAGGTQSIFPINTSPVSSPVFSRIGVNIETHVPQSGGGTFLQHRLKSSYIAVLTSGAPNEPPALLSLALAPTSLIGGSSSQATITLTRPAPAEGAAVALASSNPSIASTPPSVTFAAGASSTTFTVTTSPIVTTNTIGISASFNGLTKDALLTVNSPRFVSITLNPTSVNGGTSSQGTVTLNGPAPAGGALFTLSSSNSSAASVPAEITIPAGATNATFTITTTAVTATTNVFISASYAGVSLPAQLAVTTTGSGGGGDTVAIQRAEYNTSKRELRIEATSSSSSAVLRVYVTSTNQLIGTLSNNGGGRYSSQLNWSTNPQNITIRSSLGGVASRAVTLK